MELTSRAVWSSGDKDHRIAQDQSTKFSTQNNKSRGDKSFKYICSYKYNFLNLN